MSVVIQLTKTDKLRENSANDILEPWHLQSLSEKTLRVDNMKDVKTYKTSLKAESNDAKIDTRKHMQYRMTPLITTIIGAILPPIVNAIMQYYFSKWQHSRCLFFSGQKSGIKRRIPTRYFGTSNNDQLFVKPDFLAAIPTRLLCVPMHVRTKTVSF